MQKKSLLQFWLLLCLMIAGATHAWAVDVSWSASDQGYKNQDAITNVNLDANITATFAKGTNNSNVPKYYTTGEAVRCYGGNTFTISSSETATITKIVLTFGSGDGSNAITTDVGTYSAGTWEGSAKSITFTIGGTSGNRRIAGIAVTYTPGTNAKLTGISLGGTYPTTFTEGAAFSHEGMIVTATFDDNTEEEVTSSASFSGYNMATTGEQTVTVSYTANDVTKTATYTITVNAIPTHTVTWSVNGQTYTTTDVKEGAAIEFPQAPGNVNGKVFVGWRATPIDGVTNDAPEMVTEATMGTADVTFYAVFADAVGAEAVTDKLNREFTGVTGTSYEAWNSKKGDSGAMYAGQSAGGNSSIQLRSDNNNSGVVTTTSAGKVSKVAVKWNSNTADARVLNVYGSNTAYTAATDLYDANKQGTLLGTFTKEDGDKEMTINGDYKYVGVRSASGALYLASLSITWGGYSGYCTTVAKDTRAEAGISFAEAEVTKEIVENYTGQTLANSNDLTVTWTSSNENVATVEDGIVTVKAVGQTTITAAFAGNDDYKPGSASYTLIIQDSRVEITPSFAEASVSVNVKETVNAPALNGNTGQAAVSYESSDPTIATVNEQGVVTGVADGEATITATIAATNQYQSATATFTVNVIDPNKKGTQTNPYTVAEAIDAIDNNGDVTGVYATGIVSQIVTAYNSQYGNITYDISADGTTESTQLRVYRGKSYDGENFTSADDIQVGDVVVVYGDLTLFSGSTYEFGTGNQLVSLSRKATPTLAFEQESYTVEKEAALTITATSDVEGVNIVYSSSDTEVADIDAETGEVHAKAAGTTTITATVAETENYKGATASVELTVNDSSIPVVYHDIHFYVARQEYGDGARIVHGQTLTFPEDPTVEDYAFAGWSTTNDVNAPEFVSDATVVEDNMDLYAMFVAKAGETVYQLVESDQTDWRGNYLIAYSNGIFADGRKSGTDGIGAANASAIPGNNLKGKVVNAAWGDKYCVTLEAIDDNNISSGYLLKTQDGLYNYQSSNKNGIASSDNKETAQAYPITVNFKSSNDIELALGGKAEGAVFHYNPGGYFRFYKDGSQSPVYLYKKVAGTPIYFDGTIVDEVALSDVQDYIATTATVAKKVTLTRTVKANTWSSFVVPFDMAKPEGVELKELTSSEINANGDVRLNFTEATAIEAGKPYMMRSKNNEITKFSADDAVVLPAAQKQDAATTYVDMVGTYARTSIPTGDYFFSNNVFKYVGATAVTTKGFRAYFHLHDVPVAEGEARIVAFGLDDETTGIDELKQNAESRKQMFDLSGRKVAQPTRGLYIVNGKKLFVK